MTGAPGFLLITVPSTFTYLIFPMPCARAVNPQDGPPGHEDGHQPAPVAGGGGGEPPDERQALRRRRAAPRIRRAPRRRQGDTGDDAAHGPVMAQHSERTRASLHAA